VSFTLGQYFFAIGCAYLTALTLTGGIVAYLTRGR
jgi:hypothetical protein